MKPGFEQAKSGKKLENWTYTQSYPHYPQKSESEKWKNIGKNKKICSVQNNEKKLILQSC